MTAFLARVPWQRAALLALFSFLAVSCLLRGICVPVVAGEMVAKEIVNIDTLPEMSSAGEPAPDGHDDPKATLVSTTGVVASLGLKYVNKPSSTFTSWTPSPRSKPPSPVADPWLLV